MAEKVNLLLRDEKLRLKMGETARNFVLNNFSYHKTLEIYLGYFRMYVGV